MQMKTEIISNFATGKWNEILLLLFHLILFVCFRGEDYEKELSVQASPNYEE